ncbi:MAG: DUF4038 domain-containing protein [Bacteroidota bacterium]
MGPTRCLSLLCAALVLWGCDSAQAPPTGLLPPGQAANGDRSDGVARVAPERYIFPLRVDNQRIVDATGTPVFLHGDAAWSGIVNLTRDEIDHYLADRKRKGFTALKVNLIDWAFSDQTPGWRNADGHDPFLGTVDGYVPNMTRPNEPYWQLADYFIRRAGEMGLIVVAFPSYSGWEQGFDGWAFGLYVNGVDRLRTYGEFVGARYADQPHVIWSTGGDWGPNGPQWDLRDHYAAVAAGIRATDGDQLWTGHGGQESGLDAYAYIGLDLNTTYRYPVAEVPEAVYRDYTRSQALPFVFFEGRYENESEGTARNMRYQAYTALLGGAFGQFYGNRPVWYFGNGWQSALGDPGAMDMIHVGDLARSRALHTLVPDYDGRVVTSDRGSRSDGNWVAAARAADGSTAVVYVPDSRAITVDLSQVRGAETQAWCFTPSTGEASDLGRYPANGVYSFGACASPDWVLVLDAVDG